jgi:hypothetical protein
MRSEKQIQASRENGKKSRGPGSGGARRMTAMTRLQQALCTQAVVLDNESRESFLAIMSSLRRNYQPEGPIQEALIEELASCFWRLRRVWAIQTAMLNGCLPPSPEPTNDILADFRIQIERTKAAYSSQAEGTLRNLHLEEGRLHRTFNRALRSLHQLRAEAPPEPENKKSEPKPKADDENK